MSGRGIRRRAQSLLGMTEREEADLELGFHLEERVRALSEAGLPEAEARAQAERELGSVPVISGECAEITRAMRRADRRALRVERVRDDVRNGGRWLRRRPWTSAALVTVCALAVGGAEASWGLVWSTLMQPLGLPGEDRVVAVHTVDRRTDNPVLRGSSAPGDVLDWRELPAFEAITTLNTSPVTIFAGDEPERITAVLVTQDIGRVLGVRPLLGRMFRNEDHLSGSAPVVLLTREYWQRAFGADSTVVGRVVRFGSGSAEVAGVLPPMTQLSVHIEGDIWAPVDLAANPSRGGTWLRVIGRLRDGVTLENAQLELDAVMARLAEAEPFTNGVRSAWIEPLAASLTHGSRPVLLIVGLAILLVVLIASGNVAALLLAVSVDRQDEIAVRATLGATPSRLRAQFLAESSIACGIGVVLGLVIGPAAVRAFLAAYPGGLPRGEAVTIEAPVLAATLLLGCVLALLGALPLWRRVRSTDVSQALRGGGRTTRDRGAERVRTLLVATQIAFCTTLLIAGVLLLRVYRQLTATSAGFETEQLVAFNVVPPSARYPTQAQYLPFYDGLLERVRTTPGVTAASYTSLLPFDRDNWTEGMVREGAPQTPEEERFILFQRVEPTYTDVLGLPLLAGRTLTEQDHAGASRVAVINETLAREMFGAASPLGRRFGSVNRGLYEVVGVVGAKRHRDLGEEPLLEMYAPRVQDTGPRGLWIVARVADPPPLVLDRLRAVLRQLDPDIPFASAAILSERVAQSIAPQRFRSHLLGSLAAMALVLSTIGVWSLTSYSVSRQTREIGIRMALGLEPARARTLVLRQALQVAGGGVGAGAAIAWLAARAIDTRQFGLTSVDPAVVGGVATFLVVVTAAAALVPAWRASRVDPSHAMRSA